MRATTLALAAACVMAMYQPADARKAHPGHGKVGTRQAETTGGRRRERKASRSKNTAFSGICIGCGAK